MAFDTTFVDEILPAVRQGDITLLERSLSLVTNPDEYLNRIYDEDTQQCTLLTIACLNGHENIIGMILDNYKPNLEVHNSILFGDENKKPQMCTHVTVLWVAAAVNNFQIVQLLVEHGANVNHTTKTNSTPLRSACYNGNLDVARYLIAHGADVHITKENNDTNLAVSVYRKHLHMATYLVDELGCDVNVCDIDGRSPLYDAVNRGSMELAEFLLNRGARNFRASYDQMSPLMWAAEKRHIDLMRLIASHSSLIEQIEAEELFGSAFVCTNLDERDVEQCFEHFHRALELRLGHQFSKVLPTTTTKDIFEHRRECQTIEQLKDLQLNRSSLCIEALLVRERLLGPHNAEYRYSLRHYGAVLADSGQHHQAIAFWMYELQLRQEYSIEIDAENLRHFASIFSEMVHLSLEIPIDALLIVMKVIAEMLTNDTKDFDYNLYTLLFLITIISRVCLFFFAGKGKSLYCLAFRKNGDFS